MTDVVRESNMLCDERDPLEICDTVIICLICSATIPVENANQESEATQGSKQLLNDIARVLQVSQTIYQKTDVDSVPMPLLCTPCFDTVSSAIELQGTMATLQCQLQRQVQMIKSELIRSYNGDRGNQEGSSSRRFEEVKRIRKTYAQCWVPCEVGLDRTARASNKDVDEEFIFAETANAGVRKVEVQIPIDELNMENSAISESFDYDDSGDEDEWEQEHSPENITISEHMIPGARLVPNDPFENFPENKTFHRSGKVFTKAFSLKIHLNKKKGTCRNVEFKGGSPTQVSTAQISEKSWVETNEGSEPNTNLLKVEYGHTETEVHDNLPQLVSGFAPFSGNKNHSGSHVGWMDFKVETPEYEVSDHSMEVESISFKCMTCSATFQFKEEFEMHKKQHILEKFRSKPIDTTIMQDIGCSSKTSNVGNIGPTRSEKSFERDVSVKLKPNDSVSDNEFDSSCSKYESGSEYHPNSSDNDIPEVEDTKKQKISLNHKVALSTPKNKTKEHLKMSGSNPLNHQKGPFRCSYCIQIFKTERGLKRHILRRHNENIQLSFKCHECNKSFQQRASLKKHLLANHPENSFKCYYCSKIFKSKPEIRNHYELIHAMKSFPCTLCEAIISNQSVYDSHLELHNGAKDFPCKECPARFNSARDLQLHQIAKHVQKNYKCKICQKVFTSPTGLNRHNKIEHGIVTIPRQIHQCTICKKSFTRNHILTIHMKTHEKTKLLKCKSCGETFQTHKQRRLHRIWHARGCPPKLPEPTFTCSICNEIFFDKYLYDFHMRKHENPEESISKYIQAKLDENKNLISFECRACNEKFLKDSYLNTDNQLQILCQHRKCSCNVTYSDLREFMDHHKNICNRTYWLFESGRKQCSTCGKDFANQRSLLVHVRCFHPKPGSWTCRTCGKEFDEQSLLESHVLCHRLKKFQCDKCGYRTWNTSHLKLHFQSKHVEVRNYVCDVCGKMFKAANNLKKHKINMHSNAGSQFPCRLCGKMFKCKRYVTQHIYSTHEKRRQNKKPKPPENHTDKGTIESNNGTEKTSVISTTF